tara:strand:+ start:13538 stop:13969 length:432 start_codon:yes stop_codon:yes gene_type:complete
MNNYVGIPVSDLMCVDMPSAYLLQEEGALEMDEIPEFFNTVQAAVSVWADFLGRITHSRNDWAEPRHEFVSMLGEVLEEVYDNDDPVTAWPLRQKLALMIDQFDEMADEMARPFTGPETVRNFYHNLGSRVRATFELVLHGVE